MNALPKLLKLALLPLLAASLQAASTYKVQSGDTLSSIARKNGTTSSQLMKNNGISNPNLLKIGQVLKVSGSSARPAPSKPRSSTSSTTSGNYTVKAGETLYSIARKHGLSVSQLTGLNPRLNPSQLSVGQKIQTRGAASSKPKATAKPKATPKPKAVATPKPKPKPKATPKPVAKPMPVIAKTTPPISKPEVKPAPISKPTPEPKMNLIAEKKIEIPSAISSVMVSKEISFGALASRHRSSTKQLNELNGWSLKPTTILAKGSEIYVPGT